MVRKCRRSKTTAVKYWLWWAPKRHIRTFFEGIKFAWQRAYRGYDDSAWWSLDDYLAKISAPVLAKMAERSPGYPPDLTEAEWTEILWKMHKAMKIIADDDICSRSDEQMQEIKEGTELFGKWFIHLWT